MKNLSVAITVTRGTDALPLSKSARSPEPQREQCQAEWVHLGSSTDKFGKNIQTTLRSLLLFFQNGSGMGSLTVCGRDEEQAGLKRVGRNEMQPKLDSFSVHAIIAVYLPDVHSPQPWQQLGWNQLTGWVVRGGTCMNNFSPVGAVVVWADSQRAKLAGF